MNIHKLFVGAALSLASMVGGCSTETHLITHVAQVHLDSARYSTLISSLDVEMSHIGLTRYGAGPGLIELKGRDVLFADYRFRMSDNWGFLTADDVQKVGVVEIRVYSTVFKDQRARHEAVARLNALLGTFGARLVERSTAEKP